MCGGYVSNDHTVVVWWWLCCGYYNVYGIFCNML